MDERPTAPFVIPESDEGLLAECRIETFRAGGKGGQHQNTTDSGVRLVHGPSGIAVEGRRSRSQARNKADALARLRNRIEAKNRTPPTRIQTRVPKAERKRRLEQKRRASKTKRLRKKPDPDQL